MKLNAVKTTVVLSANSFSGLFQFFYVDTVKFLGKALCDELYIQSPVTNQKELKEFLFDGLRIDWDTFCKLNVDDITFLSEKYHCTNIQKLQKIMEKLA